MYYLLYKVKYVILIYPPNDALCYWIDAPIEGRYVSSSFFLLYFGGETGTVLHASGESNKRELTTAAAYQFSDALTLVPPKVTYY